MGTRAEIAICGAYQAVYSAQGTEHSSSGALGLISTPPSTLELPTMKIYFTDASDGTLRTVDRPLKTLLWEALSIPFLVPAVWRALCGGW